MKTYIEDLKEIFPDLSYEDGYLFHNEKALEKCDPYITEIDAKNLIADYYEGRELCDNPNEPDPTKEVYVPVDGHTYIKYRFAGDYSEALNSITP